MLEHRGWLPKLFAVTCLFSLAVGPLRAQTLPGIPLPSAVAVDSKGAIYLAGYSFYPPLTTTAGVFEPAVPPGGCTESITAFCTHGFVAKISPSGESVEWATYLTGAAPDSVSTLAVAGDGNVYVAGTTTSATLVPGPSGNPSGAPRIFVAKLSSDGKSLLAATYFGGSGTESIRKLVLDAAGNVYIAGTTASADFPTTPGAYQRTLGASGSIEPGFCTGGTDEFVAKFDPTLKSVLFSTLIGSPAAERTDDFAIGPDGSLYIAATILPERDSQCTAALLTRLNPQGSAVVYSAFLQNAHGYALAVDSAGAAYLASDDRVYGVASPEGTVFKIDSQGKTVAMANLNGWVDSLAAGNGGVAMLGRSWPGSLIPTPGAPSACYKADAEMVSVPFLATLDPSTLIPTYLGYLTSYWALMSTGDRVVAANPYGTLLPYAVLPAGPPAAGTVICTSDAADYLSDAVAPGEIVSLFGIGIGPAVPAFAQLDAHGNIGPELAGVEVLANGAPAPLLYAASGQINLVLPFGVTGDKVHLELYRNGSLVTQFDKPLVPQHPGVFATGAVLNGPLAALNQDGSANGGPNPAAPGSIVSIFATGLGVMTPQLPDGALPAAPVNTPVLPIQVLVNQQQADILYIGNAPTLVQGVVQINLRLPNPIPMPFGSQPGQAYVGLCPPPLCSNGTITGGTVAVR